MESEIKQQELNRIPCLCSQNHASLQPALPPVTALTRLFLLNLQPWLLCQLPASSLCLCHFVEAFLPHPQKFAHVSAKQPSHPAVCCQSPEESMKPCSSNAAQSLLHANICDASPLVQLSAFIKKPLSLGLLIAESECKSLSPLASLYRHSCKLVLNNCLSTKFKLKCPYKQKRSLWKNK